MKALVKTVKGPGNIEIRNVDIPKIAEDEVLLQRVQQSWIKQVGESPTSVTASGLGS